MQQQTVIKLSGSLAAKFGRIHVRSLESGKTWEAFQALKHTVKGFEQFLNLQAKRGMRYAIFRNGKNVGKEQFDLNNTNEIRIVPIIQGSKRGGIFQTIVGAVMVVAGMVLTAYGFGGIGVPMTNMGYAMIVGGVVQMLSPQNLANSDSEDSGQSYAFGGAVNTSAAGKPIPMGYGKRKVGGAIISAGIYAEDQRATSSTTAYGNSRNYGNQIEP